MLFNGGIEIDLTIPARAFITGGEKKRVRTSDRVFGELDQKLGLLAV